MAKVFNVNGACRPEKHYMVDLTSRLREIRAMVDDGEYFVINRARQYGKTTTLRALARFLREDYVVVSLDFQKMSAADFAAEGAFVAGMARETEKAVRRSERVSERVKKALAEMASGHPETLKMADLFGCLSALCEEAAPPVVLMIDEVDTASNNQVFLDFLAQLRAYYLDSDVTPTFHSVILAGVYDIRNVKRKIRPDETHRMNSPWNIAADFNVDMNFRPADIAGMLDAYEADHRTGMEIDKIADLLYAYTDGYPYLVSRLCRSLDEEYMRRSGTPDRDKVWAESGVLAAVKTLLSEKNPLFESLIDKLNRYPGLKERIRQLLFQGQTIGYNADDEAADLLLMFGFVKVEQGNLRIANRIFETRLYNYFLMLPENQDGELYRTALRDKNRFIQDDGLNMELILEKFVEYFEEIYGDRGERFLEEDGRRFFMLYLKPIINGVGNYYVEARTRNQERTDLIVDYCGKQYIIEMKIWRGNAYHERGERQLSAYLDYYHLDRGYMLSFCFNRTKTPGLRTIRLGDKTLIEAVV